MEVVITVLASPFGILPAAILVLLVMLPFLRDRSAG
jgi:hypothetical protein